jgi:uncharacterized membrane protein YfhO
VARDGNDVENVLKSPQFDIRTAAVLEEQPPVTLPPLTSAPQWKTEITRYRNNTIDLTVDTEREGLLILSETYYPGWKATVDGQETPMYRADYNLRSLFVPAGKHTVALQFQPASFARGAMITLATLALCCTGIIIPSLRRRTARDQRPPAEDHG